MPPRGDQAHRPPPAGRFLDSYVSDLINRDVRQISDIERPADLCRLVNLVAASMASLAVPAALANRLRLPASAVKRYLDLIAAFGAGAMVAGWWSQPAGSRLRAVVIAAGAFGATMLAAAPAPDSAWNWSRLPWWLRRARRSWPAAKACCSSPGRNRCGTGLWRCGRSRFVGTTPIGGADHRSHPARGPAVEDRGRRSGRAALAMVLAVWARYRRGGPPVSATPELNAGAGPS